MHRTIDYKSFLVIDSISVALSFYSHSLKALKEENTLSKLVGIVTSYTQSHNIHEHCGRIIGF